MEYSLRFNTVSAWWNIWSADNPVEVLNTLVGPWADVIIGYIQNLHLSNLSICPCWFDVLYHPCKVTRVHNKDKPWLIITSGVILIPHRWLFFCELVITIELTGKNLSAVQRELMKHTLRPDVGLMSKTVIFYERQVTPWPVVHF